MIPQPKENLRNAQIRPKRMGQLQDPNGVDFCFPKEKEILRIYGIHGPMALTNIQLSLGRI